MSCHDRPRAPFIGGGPKKKKQRRKEKEKKNVCRPHRTAHPPSDLLACPRNAKALNRAGEPQVPLPRKPQALRTGRDAGPAALPVGLGRTVALYYHSPASYQIN